MPFLWSYTRAGNVANSSCLRPENVRGNGYLLGMLFHVSLDSIFHCALASKCKIAKNCFVL